MLRKILLPVVIVAMAGVGYVAYKIANADYNADIPPEQACRPNRNFKLSRHLAGIDPASLRLNFPYRVYLDSADWCSAEGVLADLRALDTIRPDSARANRELLFFTLTTVLEKRWESRFTGFKPDTLIELAQWASRFYAYKDAVSADDARVFRIVSRHWFIKLSNALGQFAETEAAVKYGFKFRHLVGLCQSRGFSPPISNSKLEKTVIYFIDQKYGYLFHRFWNSTDWKFKTVSGLGLIVLLYGFLCIFKVHFKK